MRFLTLNIIKKKSTNLNDFVKLSEDFNVFRFSKLPGVEYFQIKNTNSV